MKKCKGNVNTRPLTKFWRLHRCSFVLIHFQGRTSSVFLNCIIVARGILADFQIVRDTECSGISSYSQHVSTGPDTCEANCNNTPNCKGNYSRMFVFSNIICLVFNLFYFA